MQVQWPANGTLQLSRAPTIGCSRLIRRLAQCALLPYNPSTTPDGRPIATVSQLDETQAMKASSSNSQNCSLGNKCLTSRSDGYRLVAPLQAACAILCLRIAVLYHTHMPWAPRDQTASLSFARGSLKLRQVALLIGAEANRKASLHLSWFEDRSRFTSMRSGCPPGIIYCPFFLKQCFTRSEFAFKVCHTRHLITFTMTASE